MLFEGVGLVAANARAVSPLEERRRGNDGFLLLMTSGAGVEGVFGAGVLVLVASSAHLNDALSAEPMAHRSLGELLMTLAAGCDVYLLVTVRSMTAEARRRAVHLHRWRIALRFRVTAKAVFGSVRAGLGQVRRRQVRSRLSVRFGRTFRSLMQAKYMAGGAVRFGGGPEAFVRLGFGVHDRGLFLVAGGAALGSEAPHAVLAHGVAGGARDVLIDDVGLMAGLCSSLLPLSPDVDPVSERTRLCFVGTADDPRHTQRDQQPHDGQASLGERTGQRAHHIA